MKKIDLHLHLTPFQIPKLGKMNLASAKNMIPHLEELGIACPYNQIVVRKAD